MNDNYMQVRLNPFWSFDQNQKIQQVGFLLSNVFDTGDYEIISAKLNGHLVNCTKSTGIANILELLLRKRKSI